MSLIHEIHAQKPLVRYSLFTFSVIMAVSVVGFFWFTSMQKDVFFAMHDDPKERQAFLDKQNQLVPHPLAVVGQAARGLTASIGSLIGWDSSKGFDRTDSTDHNQAAYPLPISN